MADLYSRISFLLVIYLDVCKFQSLNLALKKPAWMSSVNSLREIAANAVDGSHGTDIRDGVCSHTNFGDMSPWFVVDLLGQYSVHNVTIYNRGDCCGERLHDFVIQVYVRNPSRCPSAAFSICKNYTGTFGSMGNIACDAPVFGRFIRLWKPKIRGKADVLNFCELEVYGVQPGRTAYINKSHLKKPLRFRNHIVIVKHKDIKFFISASVVICCYQPTHLASIHGLCTRGQMTTESSDHYSDSIVF
ncbi:fucolectin-1-like [Haliotis rufescens]|uniref:fucolectin-1-like n=1 Tax=Haliotis rufescens TaxID=6454 RepID=UPI00201EF6AC|nr:fucolectin-1-like [Haliotis rufescens]